MDVIQPSPKRAKTGFFSAFEEFVNEGPPVPSGAVPLSQDADPLRFWEANSTATVLQPLLPLVASVAAVPATEAICERLFKAGGQVLTSARLRMMGSRVESILMTGFNSKQADAGGA
uniref:HAT C-terminal dimerisation domain-containing protein n=1 Tax=Cryptomonas curvata TaxID=233186 RepID=A0A7S0MUZ2_9CRYP|mmetsp:Transcript_54976/g.115039  ORF Transcript_54976/g.115039 Transcript_54976/m.115039 type:complete len:117 (+) Transcript_54976:227-577(+)